MNTSEGIQKSQKDDQVSINRQSMASQGQSNHLHRISSLEDNITSRKLSFRNGSAIGRNGEHSRENRRNIIMKNSNADIYLSPKNQDNGSKKILSRSRLTNYSAVSAQNASGIHGSEEQNEDSKMQMTSMENLNIGYDNLGEQVSGQDKQQLPSGALVNMSGPSFLSSKQVEDTKEIGSSNQEEIADQIQSDPNLVNVGTPDQKGQSQQEIKTVVEAAGRPIQAFDAAIMTVKSRPMSSAASQLRAQQMMRSPQAASQKNVKMNYPLQVQQAQPVEQRSISFQQIRMAPFGSTNVPLRQLASLELHAKQAFAHQVGVKNTMLRPDANGVARRAPGSAVQRPKQRTLISGGTTIQQQLEAHDAAVIGSSASELRGQINHSQNLYVPTDPTVQLMTENMKDRSNPTSYSLKNNKSSHSQIQQMNLINVNRAEPNQVIQAEIQNQAARFQNETIQDSVKSAQQSFGHSFNVTTKRQAAAGLEMTSQETATPTTHAPMHMLNEPSHNGSRASLLEQQQSYNIIVHQQAFSAGRPRNQGAVFLSSEANTKTPYRKPARKLKNGKSKSKKELSRERPSAEYTRRKSAMQVQHQTNFKQQAESLARSKLFGREFGPRMHLNQICSVEGNSFMLSGLPNEVSHSLLPYGHTLSALELQSPNRRTSKMIRRTTDHGGTTTMPSKREEALMGLFAAHDSSASSDLRLVGGRISASSNPYGRKVNSRTTAVSNMRGYTASSAKTLARPLATAGSSRPRLAKAAAMMSESERFTAAEAETSLSETKPAANVRILRDKDFTESGIDSAKRSHCAETEANLSYKQGVQPDTMSYMNKSGRAQLNQNNNENEQRTQQQTVSNSPNKYHGTELYTSKQMSEHVAVSNEERLAKPTHIQGVEIVLKSIPSHMATKKSQVLNPDVFVNNEVLQQNLDSSIHIVKKVNMDEAPKAPLSRQAAGSQLSSTSGGDKVLKNLLKFKNGPADGIQQEPNLDVFKIQNDLINYDVTNEVNRANSQVCKSQKQIANAEISLVFNNIDDGVKTTQSFVKFMHDKQIENEVPYQIDSDQSWAFERPAQTRVRKIQSATGDRQRKAALGRLWMTKFFKKRAQVGANKAVTAVGSNASKGRAVIHQKFVSGGDDLTKAGALVSMSAQQLMVLNQQEDGDGPDSYAADTNAESHVKTHAAHEQLEAMTGSDPLLMGLSSTKNLIKRKHVDPRTEKKKLAEMPVKDRIEYIFMQKMRQKEADRARSQAADFKQNKHKNGFHIAPVLQETPESAEFVLAANKQNFDFNLTRAKQFRQRDLKDRERSLEENERLYYDMKKFNERLNVTEVPKCLLNQTTSQEEKIAEKRKSEQQESYGTKEMLFKDTFRANSKVLSNKQSNRNSSRNSVVAAGRRSPMPTRMSIKETSTERKSGCCDHWAPKSKKLKMYDRMQAKFARVFKDELTKLRMRPDGLLGELPCEADIIAGVESIKNSQLSYEESNDDGEPTHSKQTKSQHQQRHSLHHHHHNFHDHHFSSVYEQELKQSKDERSSAGINVFREQKGKPNRLVSTAIRVLGGAGTSNKNSGQNSPKNNRFYMHRDQEIKLDPMRNKVRWIPAARVEQALGSAPVMFMQAATKHCIRNNVSQAIASLHKGLAIDATHFYVRLTHGIVMFKLGLFTQARHDFAMVSRKYPKEALGHYNYALTLLQIGELQKALPVIELITSKHSLLSKGADAEFMHDAHMLRAQCLWRCGKALEAVLSLELAKKFMAKISKRKQRRLSTKELADKLWDLELKEMKHDLRNEKDFVKRNFARSPTAIHISRYQESHGGSTFGDEQQRDFTDLGANERPKKQIPTHIAINQRVVDRQYLDIKMVYERSASTLSDPGDGQTPQGESITMDQLEDPAKQKHASEKMKSNISPTRNILKNISEPAKAELEALKQEWRQMESTKRDQQKQQFKKKVANFYGKLRAGTELKLDNVYQHVLQPENEREVSKQRKKIHSMGLTAEEEKLILMRKLLTREIEQDISDSAAAVYGRMNDQTTDLHASKTGIDYSSQCCQDVKVREVEGAKYHDDGIVEINRDQKQLDIMMSDLRVKLDQTTTAFSHELDKDDKKIFQRELKDEDISEYKHAQVKRASKGKDGDKQMDAFLYGGENDKIMAKLQQTLKSDAEGPIDLCNVLQADLDKKEKQRKIQQDKRLLKNERLDARKVDMIKAEFDNLPGEKRSLQILDLILGGLKFFQRFDENQRHLIYQKAEYERHESQYVVFRQGDRGDKMYVIIKGRVDVEKKSPDSGDLPISVAVLSDGDHFGELSLIDQEKVDQHTKNSPFIEVDLFDQTEKVQFSGRKATCITTEVTDMLVISPELHQQLYQPDTPQDKSDSCSHHNGQLQDTESMNTSQRNDELSRKIRVLQSVPYFRDLRSRTLMPIAANAKMRSYRYGECLVERGKVPDGLFILIKGRCQIVATRNAMRRLRPNSQAQDTRQLARWQPSTNGGNNKMAPATNYKQLGIKDPLIYDFDPETSVLNHAKSDERAFSHQRVMIDANGKEIKDRVEYTDFMTFSQLTEGEVFGGRTLVPYEEFFRLRRDLYGLQSLQKYYPPGCDKAAVDRESTEHYHMKSLLTVVADSARVDVWVIDRQDLNYLSDTDLRQGNVYERIVYTKEADRPCHEQDLNFIIDQFVKWDHHKVDVVEAMFARNKIAKRLTEGR